MKRLIAMIILAICVISQSFLCFSRATVYPIFDEPEAAVIPRHLRIMQQPLQFENMYFKVQGLDSLKASGSGQFSEKTFIEMAQRLPTDVARLVVFDLREESHGLVNGIAISWTDGPNNYPNINKTRQEIEKDENQRLKLAVRAGSLLIDSMQGSPAKLAVSSVKTERELVENLGARYIRLPVTDHNRPTDEMIDQFIELVKVLPEDCWVHFHCRAGKGRTTTFLSLLDIMKNAQQVSLEDILTRQKIIGGADLSKLDKKEKEKKRAALERLEFIKHFYAYCEEMPDFQMSWSAWSKQQSAMAKNR